MTREIALHCMKSYSELHSDLCELCPIYGQTGDDHCFEDALQYVIGMLEKEPILDKIRAEIERIANEEQKHDEKWAIGLRYAVKIIDKHIKESSDADSN